MGNKPVNLGENALPAGLSQPAQRALAGAGITNLDQLSGYSESEIKKLHGIGPRALDLLRSALAARGKGFALPGEKP